MILLIDDLCCKELFFEENQGCSVMFMLVVFILFGGKMKSLVEFFLKLFLVFELDDMLQFYGGDDGNYIQDLQYFN